MHNRQVLETSMATVQHPALHLILWSHRTDAGFPLPSAVASSSAAVAVFASGAWNIDKCTKEALDQELRFTGFTDQLSLN